MLGMWYGVLWRVACVQVGCLKGVGSPFLEDPGGEGPDRQTQTLRLGGRLPGVSEGRQSWVEGWWR